MRRRAFSTPSAVIGGSCLFGTVTVAVLADILVPQDPLAAAGPALSPPSAEYIMGTDNFGRDILAAVVHGVRTSLTIAFSVGVISLVLGLLVGLTAGYRGGWIDDTLMRITEMFQAVPLFFFALLVVAFVGASVDNLILLLGFTSWELLARVVRAETLSLRERDFVTSARSLGASHPRVIWRHLLPNVLPTAVVVTALIGSRVILIEAALSFIGLGDPNQVSLGYLIFNAQAFLQVAWWMSVFPGLAIVVAVLGFNLTGDLLNDALDPWRAARPLREAPNRFRATPARVRRARNSSPST